MISLDSPEHPGSEFNTLQTQDVCIPEKPPLKRFKHLPLVCDLLDKESNTDVVIQSKEDEEFERYMKNIHSDVEMSLELLDYWISKSKIYPLLCPVVCDILSIPTSTARVILFCFTFVLFVVLFCFIGKLPKEKEIV